MSDEELKRVIDSAICLELQTARNFTTRATLYLRVLRRIIKIMKISWSFIPEIKNMIYLEPEIVELIESCFHSQITSENNDELEKFLGKDYVKTVDMLKFINNLNRREMKQNKPLPSKIYKILGMDGFNGTDIKRYIEYLKYSSDDFRGVHVRAVRKLYDNITSLDRIQAVLYAAYGWTAVEDESEIDIKKQYLMMVDNHIEKIIQWKTQQSKEYAPISNKEGNKRTNAKRNKAVKRSEPTLTTSSSSESEN